MRLVVTKDHRHFFEQNGWIEFADFVKPNTLSEVRQGIEKVICHRLKITPEKLHTLSSLRSFVAGRDIWRSDDVVKRLVMQQAWAQIVYELTDQKPVRLAIDQYLPKLNTAGQQDKSAHELESFLTQTQTLQDVASLQGLLCGLMICLDSTYVTSENSPGEENARHTAPFPLIPGHATFFNPSLPFSFHDTYAVKGDYLLIVYADNRAVYIHQTNDPFNHVLKNFGYVYGDRLNDVLNPIVFR